MKRIIYLLCLIGYNQIAAQDASYLFNVDSVEIVFEITQTDSGIKEKISITNHSKYPILIPKLPILKQKYFFNLENALYSFSGVRNSMTGEMNLEGIIKLIKIEKGNTFKYQVDVNPQEDVSISEFYFSFDFLKNVEVKGVKKEKEDYYIKGVDYYDLSRMIYSKNTSTPSIEKPQ